VQHYTPLQYMLGYIRAFDRCVLVHKSRATTFLYDRVFFSCFTDKFDPTLRPTLYHRCALRRLLVGFNGR